MTSIMTTVEKKYHKISGLYKRDGKGRFTSEWAKPEFEYLYRLPWNWTEKIDGTNIRIGLNDRGFEIRGKSDKAQLPPGLVANIQDVFQELMFTPTEQLSDWMIAWRAGLEHTPVTLYGEGYGAGIQKDGGLYRPDKSFILFDVFRGGRWLERQLVEEIAAGLGIGVVPILMREVPIPEAIHYLHDGPSSVVSTRYRAMEGVVGVPAVPLLNQWGERVIVKLKAKDHKE